MIPDLEWDDLYDHAHLTGAWALFRVGDEMECGQILEHGDRLTLRRPNRWTVTYSYALCPWQYTPELVGLASSVAEARRISELV